jgi:hypothetical protein
MLKQKKADAAAAAVLNGALKLAREALGEQLSIVQQQAQTLHALETISFSRACLCPLRKPTQHQGLFGFWNTVKKNYCSFFF